MLGDCPGSVGLPELCKRWIKLSLKNLAHGSARHLPERTLVLAAMLRLWDI